MADKNFTIVPFQEKINKPWGYELILSPKDAPITSKIIHLNPGHRFSLQYHDQKEEVLTLINGEAMLYIEDEKGTIQKIKMEQQKGYFIKVNQKHRCQGVTDCDILESSTPETSNTVRLEDDYSRGNETEAQRKQRTKSDIYMG